MIRKLILITLIQAFIILNQMVLCQVQASNVKNLRMIIGEHLKFKDHVEFIHH